MISLRDILQIGPQPTYKETNLIGEVDCVKIDALSLRLADCLADIEAKNELLRNKNIEFDDLTLKAYTLSVISILGFVFGLAAVAYNVLVCG